MDFWRKDNFIFNYPHFEKTDRIGQIVASIKQEIDAYCQQALCCLMKQYPFAEDKERHYLISYPHLAIIAVKAHRYGCIYWMTAQEAKAWSKQIKCQAWVFNEIDDLLDKYHLKSSIINYAVFRFVKNANRHCLFKHELVPKRTIMALGNNTIAIREDDFSMASDKILFCQEALYDLHDFAHFAARHLDAN